MDFGFIDSLNAASRKGRNPIIAEIKPYSPLYGDLLRNRDVEDVLTAYQNAGVAAISYITAKEFRGSVEILRRIRDIAELPVLRKDFIRDTGEIERSAEIGVSAVLLIAKHLKDETPEFADFCFEHGIEPLVEVHRSDDLEYIENARAILINNRDIDKMETEGDIKVTARLASKVNGFKVSGSGIRSITDLLFVLEYVDAALIGTIFMMAENTEEFVKSFVEAKK